MVAQEDAPLCRLGNRWGVAQDVDDGLRGLAVDAHEDARHDGEVERHLALVAVSLAEVGDDLIRHLVGLGQQETAGVLLVKKRAHPFDEPVGLGQVLAVGALSLEEVGDGVEADAVHAEVEPEADDVEDFLLHGRVVVIQVRLVGEETVPVVLLAHRVEGPVRFLGVDEDDAGLVVLGGIIRPDVVIAVGPAGIHARLLEPVVRIRGVVDGEVRDDADPALVGAVNQGDEVFDGTELGQDLAEIADVVAAVAQWGVVERRQPEAVHAEPLEVVEFFLQALQGAGAGVVRVVERADENLVEHRVLVPLGVGALPRLLRGGGTGEVGGLRGLGPDLHDDQL